MQENVRIWDQQTVSHQGMSNLLALHRVNQVPRNCHRALRASLHPTPDVVTEVMLPHHLHHSSLPRNLHKGLGTQHDDRGALASVHCQ